MKTNFYRAFEDRHRGSRELILQRLGVYLDFLRPIAATLQEPLAIDLGCGRGEFLEVLQFAGFKARGVDLDSGMLEACSELRLPAEKGNAVSFLSKLPANSHAIVSAIHVIEHLPFDQLQILVAEAWRVLMPGGLLILETPNPENIFVGTTSFHMDPTHHRPVPPPLLAFLAEFSGFDRVKTLRLQEAPGLGEKQEVSLEDVFVGASWDYSVVAQKKGKPGSSAALDEAFEKDYGLSVGELAKRYDAVRTEAKRSFERETRALGEHLTTTMTHALDQLTERSKLEGRCQELERQLCGLGEQTKALQISNEDKAAQLVAAAAKQQQEAADYTQKLAEKDLAAAELAQRLEQAEAQLAEKDRAAAELAQKIGSLSGDLDASQTFLHRASEELREIRKARECADALARDRQRTIDELLGSTCWRITAPVRWLKKGLLLARARIFEPADRALLRRATLFVRERPDLKARALKILFRYPELHARVLPVVTELKLAEAPADSSSATRNPSAVSVEGAGKQSDPPELRGLTVEAQEVYRQLAASIEQVRSRDS